MNTPEAKPPLNPWSIWIPIIIIMLGVVVLYNYTVYQSMRNDKDRPPFMTQIRSDLHLVERSGKKVNLSDVGGKIILAAHFYSTCPSGCSVIIDEMKSVYDQYAKNDPRIQFISFAIDPGDTPERLKEAADGYGITGDNWWFVNGDQPTIRTFLNLKMKFFKLEEVPEKERTSPIDKYRHDMRVALIDQKGHVRGMYEVMNPDPEFRQIYQKKLRKDLEYLLSQLPPAKP
jgi:cytochrome oxidase Cu insertion factor (SCO1/SenC/PrrC family)